MLIMESSFTKALLGENKNHAKTFEYLEVNVNSMCFKC